MPPRSIFHRNPVDHLTPDEARAEHEALGAEIAEHDRRYYQEDAPTISDAEYDALRQRNEAIEARFPELKTAESLTAEGRRQGLREVRQGAPPRADAVARQRASRTRRSRSSSSASAASCNWTAEAPLAFTAEPKIDGLSLSLRYEDGRLVTAATRGDGADGRGRHRQCPHHRATSRSGSRAPASRTSSRCAARSI